MPVQVFKNAFESLCVRLHGFQILVRLWEPLFSGSPCVKELLAFPKPLPVSCPVMGRHKRAS